MKADVPQLQFPARKDFRAWLRENAETSGAVWLVFGKTKEVATLSANDALEEALCFGWIDGQMRSINGDKYLKYFSRRRAKSHWSEKNKKIAGMLRERKLMTKLGEAAVEAAVKNGMWDAPKRASISDEQVAAFMEKLAGLSPACENFIKMPRSVQIAYTGRHLSFKSEEARQRDFAKIVDRLNNNLRPM